MALIGTIREQEAYDTGFDHGKDYWTERVKEQLTERLNELESQEITLGNYRHAWLYRRLMMIVNDLNV